ncbi:MAG: type I methionyl aminopeptidase [Phycisphaerales bacterium]|nr:type I methionyl aminopeptidase [Phycisphaerales bacterium]
MRLRSSRDIDALHRAAALAWAAVRRGLCAAQPGITTATVGALVRRTIVDAGALPAFEGYIPPQSATPFPGAACISVNEECVHAPPGPRVLEPGDLVTIDAGVQLDGWLGDVADSAVVPGADDDRARAHQALLHASRRALAAGIRACRPGARWHEVARAVRASAAFHDLTPLAGLAGHGVGRSLHEPPRAGYQTRPDDADDFLLLPGMVLTVEPVLARPPGVSLQAPDGLTVRTADGSPACHAERMVAVTRRGPRILGLSVGCSRRAGGL